jgi:endonuclease/exonuclease/phosphatase family metal-dependent hydrolase
MHSPSKTLPATIFAALTRRPARYDNPAGDQSCTTVASYNVHKCVGTDGRFDPARIASVIGEIDADIIALQEADQRFGRRAGLLDLEGLERDCGLATAWRPERLSHGWRGNVILVREGVVHDVRPMKLPGMEPRGALVVDLAIKGVPLRIIAAHLGLLRRSRSQQATALLETARARDRPTLLMGDLNEWRVRRRSSLMPLLPHFGPLDAVVPSFPARLPVLALDRILASPEGMISTIEVHDSPLARVASDHLPLKARIELSHASHHFPCASS